MARWEGGEFCRAITRYLLSSPSNTISCSVSGASSPDHRVMLPSNWRGRRMREGGRNTTGKEEEGGERGKEEGEEE